MCRKKTSLSQILVVALLLRWGEGGGGRLLLLLFWKLIIHCVVFNCIEPLKLACFLFCMAVIEFTASGCNMNKDVLIVPRIGTFAFQFTSLIRDSWVSNYYSYLC